MGNRYKSTIRRSKFFRVIAGAVAVAVLLVLPVASASGALIGPDLTHGGVGYYVLIKAGIWTGSTLVFTSQVADTTAFDMTGIFYWVAGPPWNYSGNEHFIGTFTPAPLPMLLHLEGQWVENPINVGIAVYDAWVSADGSLIYGGDWTDITEPDWMAYYEVPEPATMALLGLGGAAMVLCRRRKK